MRLAWIAACASLALACSDNGGTNDGGSDAQSDAQNSDAQNGDASKDAPSDAFDAASGRVCDPAAQFGTGTLVAASTAQSDLFGSITPDELSIAWMTAAGTVLYADRTSASDVFGAPQTLSAGIALDHVALSADGLTLVVVVTDRTTLAQTTRGSRGAAFSATLDTKPYASLDPISSEADGGSGPPHGFFSDPTLSPDGQFLYYSQYGVTTLTMCEAYRQTGDTSPWGQGRNLLETQLGAPDTSGPRMHPTGVSSDNLTLFYWDEIGATERVAFRDDPLTNNVYKQFATLGAGYQNAAPVAGCGRIYFSAPGSGGLDLFFADKK